MNDDNNIHYRNDISDDSQIIVSILNNQIKFFLCLNSNNFQIYVTMEKKPQKFGYIDKEDDKIGEKKDNKNNNDLDKIFFNCSKNESLLSFFVNNKHSNNLELNEDNNFYFFDYDEEGLNLIPYVQKFIFFFH